MTRVILGTNFHTNANRLDIEKRHWEKFLIMQKKSCQHQHYRMGRMESMKYARMKKAKTKQASIGIY